MKNLIRIVLLAVITVPMLFSCGTTDTDSIAGESELPVVEIPETVPPVIETAAPENPLYEEEPAEELPAAVQSPEEDFLNDEAFLPDSDSPDIQLSDETVPEEIMFSEPEVLTDDVFPEDYFANEFVPVEKEYFIDISGYYDGFYITEDDFVAIAVEAEPVPVLPDVPEAEPVLQEPAVQTEYDVLEKVVPETEAEAAPALEPIAVPPVREDLKKPVVLVTEEQASAATEQEKEAALTEVENILAEIPEPEEPEKLVPSRSVSIHRNDVLEVPYQGNWWVFLGDANSSGAMTFSGRDYVAEKTVFTLRAVHEGTALLHFFKQDIIGGVMVDDYLEVTVIENTGISEKIELDMFVISQIKPKSVSEDESISDDSSESTETAVRDTPVDLSADDGLSDITYVQYADNSKSAAAGSEPVSGKSVVIEDEVEVVSSAEGTDISDVAVDAVKNMTDEELFNKAQSLESTDIEEALDLYRKLISDYPMSPYWSQASKRITYINRFYFFKR